MGLAWLVAVLAIGAWLFSDGNLLGNYGYCPYSSKDLAEKRVVICGASTGIGRELAFEYARAGSEVAIVARRQAELEIVAEKCKQLGAKRVHSIVADLSSESAAAAVIAEASAKMSGGVFDILVLNHIIGFWGHWEEQWKSTSNGSHYGISSPPLSDTVSKIVDVNSLSYVYLSTHAIPVLAATNGSIVVVSSLAGRVGLPKVSIYSGSKHFLTGFFNSLRSDLETSTTGSGISVSIVYLGNIDTPNARVNTKGEVDHLHRHAANDAAQSIIKAGLCRQTEAFFPYFELRIYTYLYPFLHRWLDRLTQHLLRV